MTAKMDVTHNCISPATDEFIVKAIEYAEKRWLLDDPVLVREYCERRFIPSDTPELLMDELAERYDLTDPREVGLGT